MSEQGSNRANRWSWVVRTVAVLAVAAVGWVLLTAWAPVVHGHPAYPVLLGLTVLAALGALWRARRPRARPGRWRLLGRVVLVGALRRLGRRDGVAAPVRRGPARAGGDAVGRRRHGHRDRDANRARPHRGRRERGRGLLPTRRPGRRAGLRRGAATARAGRAPRRHRQAAPRHRLPRPVGVRRRPHRPAPGRAVGRRRALPGRHGRRHPGRRRRHRPDRPGRRTAALRLVPGGRRARVAHDRRRVGVRLP